MRGAHPRVRLSGAAVERRRPSSQGVPHGSAMVTLEQICQADQLRGAGRFHETPVHFATTLNKRLDLDERVYLKLELFQRTGSFKVRGAAAKIHALTDEERVGRSVSRSCASSPTSPR
jgi:threonine dehydratase